MERHENEIETTDVVTYQTPLPGRDISLCERHARTQTEWRLGAVQHGSHDGVCEMCEGEGEERCAECGTALQPSPYAVDEGQMVCPLKG